MEQYLQINTYLCKKGEKQEAFFILKKGKLEIIEHDQRVGTVGKPGELIHFLDPLLNPKGFSGTFSNTLLCISPVRLYKIPIAGIEELCCHHPRLILFICKWLAHHILIENDYLLHIQEVLEKDLARLAIGDTNYRRAYKKVSRLLEKFSKDPVVTKNEMTLADGLVDAIDRDYSNFREQIGKIHIASLQSA